MTTKPDILNWHADICGDDDAKRKEALAAVNRAVHLRLNPNLEDSVLCFENSHDYTKSSEYRTLCGVYGDYGNTYCTRYTTDATSALSLEWPDGYHRTITHDDRVKVFWAAFSDFVIRFNTPSLATNIALAYLWAWRDSEERKQGEPINGTPDYKGGPR